MSTLPLTLSVAVPVFVQGLALSLGLIVAIGAQNAFVLRQGLRREHVGSVVLFCALADAVLIAAGVLGMAQALGQHPNIARVLALAGAAFLAVYGWQALRRARQPQALRAAQSGAAFGLASVITQAAAISWAFSALSTCGAMMPVAPQSSTERMLASLGSPTRTIPAMLEARAANTMTSMAPRSKGACS